MTTATITESTAVLAGTITGTIRTGEQSLYYSDQLLELKDTETTKGCRLVLSQFTDEILVLQEFTADYSEQLSEQEYYVSGSVKEVADSILSLKTL